MQIEEHMELWAIGKEETAVLGNFMPSFNMSFVLIEYAVGGRRSTSSNSIRMQSPSHFNSSKIFLVQAVEFFLGPTLLTNMNHLSNTMKCILGIAGN